MSAQGLIEVVLDRWVTSTELRYIRENYRAFYVNPLAHTEMAGMIRRDLDEVML